ncbi:MAG: aldo/keto reductase [Clostridiales bacterium]|nr:aldo/keto reductase [Clostridiales bacterium]
MKQITIGNQFEASRISLGCMRLGSLEEREAERHVRTAMERGINFFDHADIYQKGHSEELFGQVFDHSRRAEVFLQSKCGIRPGYYDFSRDHILSSVEGSLKRLRTDYLDVLLLHRPDTLMEGEEVAEAFDLLHRSGKVRCFGVSNFNPMQVEYLKRYVRQPLLVNQLQFGVTHTGMIDCGIHVNMKSENSVMHDGSVLEYSRMTGMTIQAWSPFRHTKEMGVYIGNEALPEVNACLEKFAYKYDVSPSAVAIAWILRHPAGIQTILGTTRTDRLLDICTADRVEMSREDWYEIYRSAGNIVP